MTNTNASISENINGKLKKKLTDKKSLSIMKKTKAGFVGIMTAMTIGFSANTGDAKEMPKYKGINIDEIKKVQITQASSSLPDTITIGGKQVKVIYEVNSGQIASDVGGELINQSDFYIKSQLTQEKIKIFENLIKTQQNNILEYFSMAIKEGRNPRELKILGHNLVTYNMLVLDRLKYYNNPNGGYKGGRFPLEDIGLRIEKVFSGKGKMFSTEGEEMDRLFNEFLKEDIARDKADIARSDANIARINKDIKRLEILLNK